MSSPHGVFCESPHKVFIESPHGVRGCGGAAPQPFYVALSWTGLQIGFEIVDIDGIQFLTFVTRVAYNTRTRVYRIDAGRVTWMAQRPDEPPSIED